MARTGDRKGDRQGLALVGCGASERVFLPVLKSDPGLDNVIVVEPYAADPRCSVVKRAPLVGRSILLRFQIRNHTGHLESFFKQSNPTQNLLRGRYNRGRL
jgi:hypothetical protein